MTDITDRITSPITNQPTYLAEGAVGGYVGAYILGKYNNVDGMDPLGRYMVESAVAGAVGNYLWLLGMGASADTYTTWKGLVVGAVAQLIYNRWIKSYVVGVYE